MSSSSRSILTIPLGQCGNQISTRFFQTLAEELYNNNESNTNNNNNNNNKSPNSNKNSTIKRQIYNSHQSQFQSQIFQRFFRHKEEFISSSYSSNNNKHHNNALNSYNNSNNSNKSNIYARSVLVDMEPKVIEESLEYAKSNGLYEFNPNRIFTKQSGSGNNWAYGYQIHARKYSADIMELIRKEIELCDEFSGFLLFQSLAGGTGSGVGTYITECLRDEYMNSSIINQVIWPYSNGEVIVQNYNLSLTLSKLYEFSDGLILIENDELLQICIRLLNESRPSFGQINQIIAENLSNILLPSYITSNNEYNHFSMDQVNSNPIINQSYYSNSIKGLDELIQHLFPNPAYKLSSIHSIPHSSIHNKSYSSLQWNYLIKHLLQMNIANSGLEEGIDWSIKIPNALATHNKNNNNSNNNKVFNQNYNSSALSNGISINEANIAGIHGFNGINNQNINNNNNNNNNPDNIQPHIEFPIPREEYYYRLSNQLLIPKLNSINQQHENSSIIENHHNNNENTTMDSRRLSNYSSLSGLNIDQRIRRKSKSSLDSSIISSNSLSPQPQPSLRSLSSILYLRGIDCHLADIHSFTHPNLYSSYSLQSPLLITRNPISIHKDEKSSSIWSNNNSLVGPLNSMLNKVWKMYISRAYLYHYQKYGIDHNEFQLAFMNIEQIIKDYEQL